MSSHLSQLSRDIGISLLARKWHLSCAESCTGGQISATITEIAGSSEYFSYGFVTYSICAKQQLLGVKKNTIEIYGVVSQQVAQEMAWGAQRISQAKLALAVTGIAGPTGATQQKPIGLVCFAWTLDNGETLCQQQHFLGNRKQIRYQTTSYALRVLYNKFLIQ